MTESSPENTVISTKRKLAAITASYITFLLLALLSGILLDYIKPGLVSGTKKLGLPGVLGLIFCQFTIALTSAWFVFRKIARKNDRLRDKRSVQILLSMIAGVVSAIAVFMAVTFSVMALTKRFLGWGMEPGLKFWVPFGTALLCGILVGLTVTLAGLKEGRSRDLLRKCKAFFQWWAKFRFICWSFRLVIACAFWAICLFVGFSLLEKVELWSSRKQTVELGWAVIWINIPILWTVYRTFRQTEREWDWCFLVMLLAYANTIIWLSLSETWVPTVQFIKGLLVGQFIVYAIIAVGLIIRLIKRKMCLSMLFLYVVGAAIPIALMLFVQAVWSALDVEKIIWQ